MGVSDTSGMSKRAGAAGPAGADAAPRVAAPVPGPRGPAYVRQRPAFSTTHWSLVLAAGAQTCDESRRALACLCALYWYPLYAYARRRGHGADHASDLTQGFFARLLEQKIVRGADPRRGKFRSYLLGAFNHYLSHEWAKAHARKRGGGREPVALDAAAAEARYLLEPAHELTAERLYDRQWATTVLELALRELSRQSAAAGKGRQFDRLKEFLAGGTGGEYRDAGAELGMAEGAVRVVVHRMRKRYRQLVREQVALTVQSPEQVDEEVAELFAAARG